MTTAHPDDHHDPVPPLDDQPIEEVVEQHMRVHSAALTGLFLLAVLYTLHFGQVVFLPITIALLLSALFGPLLRRLKRFWIPEPVGAAVLLALLVGLFGYGVTQLVEPASEWIARLPSAFRDIEHKLDVLKEPIQEVTKVTEVLSKATTLEGAKKLPQVEVKGEGLSSKIFSMTTELMVGFTSMLILLYFLLASGDLFLQKLVKVLPRWKDKKRAVEIVREIEESLFTYLFTVTGINIGLGVAIGLAMYALGMPNPVLWGVMAAVLTYVPYIGHLFGVIVVTLVAAVTFDDLSHMLLVSGAYWALAVIEGSFVTPMILGRRLEINPVVLLLALMIWGWVWGIGGALLAVPLMVAFKIMCDHLEPLTSVGEFLGKE